MVSGEKKGVFRMTQDSCVSRSYQHFSDTLWRHLFLSIDVTLGIQRLLIDGPKSYCFSDLCKKPTNFYFIPIGLYLRIYLFWCFCHNNSSLHRNEFEAEIDFDFKAQIGLPLGKSSASSFTCSCSSMPYRGGKVSEQL